jgi:branched-subunit amino acid aminotransferase/4-amino-4-deoxychorismate lyase
MYIFLNGKILPAAFDFLQTIQGVPLFIDDYLARFKNSAKAMDLSIPFDMEFLNQNIFELIRKNNLSHSGLKLILTGGYSEDGFTPTTPNFIILENGIAPLPSDYQGYTHGAKLMLHEFVRELPYVKSVNYVTPITLQNRWKSLGAIDVLYHKDGLVTESSRSNFFIINKQNVLITPSENVLHGITRKKTLEIAQNILPIEVRNMTLHEVLDAKEAFMCSSTKGILPVVQLDDYMINDGKVGDYSKILMQKFEALQEEYIEKFKKNDE